MNDFSVGGAVVPCRDIPEICVSLLGPAEDIMFPSRGLTTRMPCGAMNCFCETPGDRGPVGITGIIGPTGLSGCTGWSEMARDGDRGRRPCCVNYPGPPGMTRKQYYRNIGQSKPPRRVARQPKFTAKPPGRVFNGKKNGYR